MPSVQQRAQVGAAPGQLAVQSNQAVDVAPLDAANVLQQTLAQLGRVRKQLQQPFAAKATVDAAISQLEAGLKATSQELIYKAQANQQTAVEAPRPSVQYGSPQRRRAPPTVVQPATERVAYYKANPVAKPHTEAARTYLQAKFGVPTSQKPQREAGNSNSSPATTSSTIGGVVARGLSSAASALILPTKQRNDPYAEIPQGIVNMELNKGDYCMYHPTTHMQGLLHIVSRGLLPAKTDLSPALIGDGAPVCVGSAPLYPPAAQHVKAMPTSALEDSLLANQHFKLDLLTPVVKASMATNTAVMHKVDLNSQNHARPAIQPSSMHGYQQACQGDQQGDSSPADQEAVFESARPYDALMDTFSLHEFMIRKGCLISNTPEFESYQRTYEILWPVIQPLIYQLELLSKQYALPLVVVDGRSLADLAHGVMDHGAPPQMQDLLVCVQNIQEVAGLLRQPGRRYLGEQGQNDAATTIQAVWRGHRARTRFSRKGLAAASIQGAWRMHRLRAQLGSRLTEARAARTARYNELQAQLAKQWPKLGTTSHVVIHIPSMRRPQPATLAQKDALLVAEAAQLCRLTDLAEPLVTVILVLSGPPNPDVLAYWDKILEVGGVDNPSARYRIMWPENYNRLPAHMSTAAMMLASPRTLKRLHAAVGGQPGYIIPGLPEDELVDLAVTLGLPVLAPPPHAARVMCCKSSARAMFRAAGVAAPPGLDLQPTHKLPPPPPRIGDNGAHPLTAFTDFQFTPEGDIIVSEKPPPAPAPTRSQYEIDEERLLLTIAEAAVRWPHIVQWVLKIDDEAGQGAGHAAFHLTVIKGAAEVLSRTALEGSGQLPCPANASCQRPLSEAQRVAVYRLSQLLYRQLPDKLTIANKEVYPGYRDFMQALAVRGGVVEAVPAALLGSPTANLLIDPTGRVALLSSHEKILVAPFCSVGSTFPQSSVLPKALLQASLAVGAACYQAGIIGHLAVDFVTLMEPGASTTNYSASSLRLWAVDISPYPTASLMAFQLFDFLTVGSWNPNTGTYTVDGEDGDEVTQQLATSVQQQEPSLQQSGVPLDDGPRIKSKLSFLQPGLPEFKGAKKVPLKPTLADEGMLGSRPCTADLPSGLPSPRGDSSCVSTPIARPPHAGGPAGVWQPDIDGNGSNTNSGWNTPRSLRANVASTYAPTCYSSRPSITNTYAEGPYSTCPGTPLSTRDGQRESLVGESGDMEAHGLAQSQLTGTQRYFFSLDALTHTALCGTPCANFFHSCWQDGFHFDVDSRTGIIFNVCDKFLMGTLGIMTVGLTPAEIMGRMQKMLAFIAAMDNANNGSKASSAMAVSAAGLKPFKDLYALVKYMADKSNALVGQAY